VCARNTLHPEAVPGLASRRILVTGGAGFIGSHVVEALLSDGHHDVIVVADDLSMASAAQFRSRTHASPKVLNADVRDIPALREIFASFSIDTVCHLATSPLVLSISDPLAAARNIIDMQLALLECQREGLYQLLLTFSTSEVYGSRPGVKLTELHRLEPRTPYAAAKAFCDQMTQSYARTFGTQFIIIRPFNNYGPRKRVLAKAGIIPTAIRCLSSGQPVTIFSDGMQARDYVFVEDTARAVQLALISEEALGETIHIASGISRTILSIVTDLATLMGVKPVYRFEQGRQGDVSFLCGDGSKASSLLNFTPTTPWHWGLERCIEYYSSASYH